MVNSRRLITSPFKSNGHGHSMVYHESNLSFKNIGFPVSAIENAQFKSSWESLIIWELARKCGHIVKSRIETFLHVDSLVLRLWNWKPCYCGLSLSPWVLQIVHFMIRLTLLWHYEWQQARWAHEFISLVLIREILRLMYSGPWAELCYSGCYPCQYTCPLSWHGKNYFGLQFVQQCLGQESLWLCYLNWRCKLNKRSSVCK